jgi:Fic family protein
MSYDIGKMVAQPGGFEAFIPAKFPPFENLILPQEVTAKLNEATRLLGKLDGIMQLLPDLEFFTFMYARKEAALSSEIEGTQATMIDALRAEIERTSDLPIDVDRILQYIKAMNYGLRRLRELPLSLRLIKEIHQHMMERTIDASRSAPGDFRKTQNWIGGATVNSARFVPPPAHLVPNALGDLEAFMHDKKDQIPSLVKTALLHAQFETIHPFLDGNGRVGRLLITFYLCQVGNLEKPVLYLSEFFKRHRNTYFELIHGYHNKGQVAEWCEFFLTGVAEVSERAIETAKSIHALREMDYERVTSFGKQTKVAMVVMKKIYQAPIVNVRRVEEWSGLSRDSANQLVKKFERAKILVLRDKSKTYARQFEHQEYLRLFSKE